MDSSDITIVRRRIQVGNALVDFVVNTGAQRSMIGIETVRVAQVKWNVNKTNVVATAYGGTQIALVGEAKLGVTYEGQIRLIDFLIARDGQNLLSRRDAGALGIMAMETLNKYDENAVNYTTLMFSANTIERKYPSMNVDYPLAPLEIFKLRI